MLERHWIPNFAKIAVDLLLDLVGAVAPNQPLLVGFDPYGSIELVDNQTVKARNAQVISIGIWAIIRVRIVNLLNVHELEDRETTMRGDRDFDYTFSRMMKAVVDSEIMAVLI
jgi:hypothetical protein